jgi:hypothetical protein
VLLAGMEPAVVLFLLALQGCADAIKQCVLLSVRDKGCPFERHYNIVGTQCSHVQPCRALSGQTFLPQPVALGPRELRRRGRFSVLPHPTCLRTHSTAHVLLSLVAVCHAVY